MHNSQTEDVAIWGITNGQVTNGHVLSSSVSGDWTIEPIGNFNSDSTDDILLTDTTTGGVSSWLITTAPVLNPSEFLLI